MAKIFNLGTKNQSLQYRVNANLAKIQRKKRKKKGRKEENIAAGYRYELKIMRDTL